MTVYRICNAAYADDLSGYGAKLYGGRWNSTGLPALYAGEFISLCVVELLVHLQARDKSTPFTLLNIELPEVQKPGAIQASKLKKKWDDDVAYTRFMGDEFLKDKNSLFLKVPSAIIPDEFNFVINPLHADFKKVKISKTRIFNFDERLLRFS